ncbi:hypothetical protein JXB01_01660 [Candidatus Micrarchaeota archaeon]|nr:hypothetical protein [Candidatus Micrarchaeota archaeon]
MNPESLRIWEDINRYCKSDWINRWSYINNCSENSLSVLFAFVENDDFWTLRKAAADKLLKSSDIHSQENIQRIKEGLKGECWITRKVYAYISGELKNEKMIMELIPLLADSEGEVRKTAVEALEKFKDSRKARFFSDLFGRRLMPEIIEAAEFQRDLKLLADGSGKKVIRITAVRWLSKISNLKKGSPVDNSLPAVPEKKNKTLRRAKRTS